MKKIDTQISDSEFDTHTLLLLLKAR